MKGFSIILVAYSVRKKWHRVHTCTMMGQLPTRLFCIMILNVNIPARLCVSIIDKYLKGYYFFFKFSSLVQRVRGKLACFQGAV